MAEKINCFSLSLPLKYHPVLKEKLAFRKQYALILRYFTDRFGVRDTETSSLLDCYCHALVPEEDVKGVEIPGMPEIQSIMSGMCRYRIGWFRHFTISEATLDNPAPELFLGLFSYRFVCFVDCLFLCAFRDEYIGHLFRLAFKDFFPPRYHQELDAVYETLYHPESAEALTSFFLDRSLTMAQGLMDAWRRNREFLRLSNLTPNLKVMITATMSAGKSTLVNALTGHRLCKTQNLACTQKIHAITGKAFEDGYVSKCDGDLILDADERDLMENNPQNAQDTIYVSAFFRGELGGKRVTLLDSPGVNSKENVEHMEIARHALQSQQYHLLLYEMNATQLGTTDDDEHLSFVSSIVRKDIPILFVINKADKLISEDDIEDILRKQTEYLKGKGFDAPCVCPVSAKAAWLAKKGRYESLSRLEERDLRGYFDQFEQCNFCAWYERTFPGLSVPDSEEETTSLLKRCGILYLEKLIWRVAYDSSRREI